MSVITSDRHPLSKRHFSQIICRPRTLQNKMRSIWAMTWRPGDRTSTFLGKHYRPVGTATLMVQASYPREGRCDGVALTGIHAQVDPIRGVVSYDGLRLKHDFHRVPVPGARGPILDPRDDHTVVRGNGTWVRLALSVDRMRAQAAIRGFRLPSVPELPRIYFGYACREQACFELTPALMKMAAYQFATEWTAESLSEISERQDDASKRGEAAFAALNSEVQQEKLQETWYNAFVPPTAADNNTGLWLLPQELATDVYSTTRIFEYFGDLVGAPVFNPARKLNGRSVANPAVEVATENGFDLVGNLALIAETVEGSAEFKQIEQRIIELIPAFRKRLKASDELTDQFLLCAMCDYSSPVLVETSIQSLPPSRQLEVMRNKLEPAISECCSDADLLQAAEMPNRPLLASGLCHVQMLTRNLKAPLAESLEFSAERLRRERIEARFWQDCHMPMPLSRSHAA